jgi:hypothetical protein
MCLSLFLYSDRALPLVAWDAASPTFNVTDLEPFEEAARGMVDVPFVYALGAHTQCACGFQRSEDEHPADVRRSIEALVDYLRVVEPGAALHLYACWSGDADRELAVVRTMTLEELTHREEWLEEGALTRLGITAAE